MTKMTTFQKTTFDKIRERVSFDRTHEGTPFTGKDVIVTEMLDFHWLGVEHPEILDEHTMHWFVRTDLDEDDKVGKASWHVTLYEDGNMSVKLLEIEKQN